MAKGKPKKVDPKVDPLDAFDPLVPKAPKTAPIDDMTDAEKAEILTERVERQKAREAATARLMEAVEAYDKAPSDDAKPAISDLITAAESLGVTVNRAAFIAKGILPAVPEPALDDLPPGEASRRANAGASEGVMEDVPDLVLPPEPDLSVLHQDASGAEMVALYNPTPGVVVPGYNGMFYAIRPGGVDLCRIEAANLAVGPDNNGGRYSRFGLRRLYLPEARFAPVAQAAGLSLVDWCAKQNAAVRFIADGMWRSIAPTLETDMDKLLVQLR